ncbi:MAG: M48 family metallopeptidase [Bacteroidota bacterium]
MFRVILLFLLCIPMIGFGQTKVNRGFKDKDVIVEHLTVNNDELRSFIFDDLPSDLRSEINERKAFQFANESAYFVTELLRGGQVYNGWNVMDKYVNDVLQEVIPDELKDQPYLKAYIVKDGSMNAFMTPSGQFFIHIGLFDALETESALAGVIAHEVAHYTQYHSAKRFVNMETQNFGYKWNRMSRNSIAAEMESDSMALVYMLDSKYDPSGLVDAMKMFQSQTEKILLRYSNRWTLPSVTHPSSNRRVATLSRMLGEANFDPSGRSHFVIGEAMFRQFKYRSQAEILKYLMEGFQFSEVIEKAFKYHLYAPENPTYLYYLMEGIRRKCYLDQGKWNAKFIVDRYHEIVGKKDNKRKIFVEGHLFDKFEPLYFNLPDDSWESIRAKFYWEGDVKFITYEQAFNFFFQVGELVNEPECILSQALSLHFDAEKRDVHLRKYLEYEKILHRDYAEALLNDKIWAALPGKRLTIFHNFYPLVRQGENDVLVWNGNEGEENPMVGKVETVIEQFPQREFMYLPDLKKSKLNRYKTLVALEQFASARLVSRGERTQLHILAPLYWEIFKEFEVNEIEFINSKYYEVRKWDFELDTYKGIVDSSYDELLATEKKPGRYLDIYYASIRMIENVNMKYRFHGGEEKLNMKDSGYTQFQTVLKRKLTVIDEDNVRP